MKNNFLKLLFLFLIFNFSSCFHSIFKQDKIPDYCVELKSKLKNRIIPINDSVYAFNFRFPQVDTFRENFETKRVFEYRNFYKFLNNLPEDSLKKCRLNEIKIKKLIGTPSDITPINKGNNVFKKGKLLNYLLDFGLRCKPNQPYLKSSGCNTIRFEIDSIGRLFKIYCSSSEWEIESKLMKIHDKIRKEIREKSNNIE